MAKDLFNRYIWLVDTIYRAGKISLEEINERWVRTEMSGGVEIPLRTFHNHRKAIEEIFDINIECNKRGGYYYYIENAEDMERGGVRSWLLNTFAVSNLINESHHLKRRILFEEIPSGQRFLTPLIEAMRDGLIVAFDYQSFRNDKPHTCTVHPYCVKVFKQRWYVLAWSEHHGQVRTYALDRIQNLTVTDRPFCYPQDFDPQAYFNLSFGIIADEACKPEVVRLKVYGIQCKYLRALPLHHSQREEEQTDDYSIFSYWLRPTFDFRQELLTHGSEIEVLSPGWLRNEISETAKEVLSLYQSNSKTDRK